MAPFIAEQSLDELSISSSSSSYYNEPKVFTSLDVDITTTARNIKKKVSFSPQVEEHTIISRSDYTSTELHNAFYNPTEMQQPEGKLVESGQLSETIQNEEQYATCLYVCLSVCLYVYMYVYSY